MTNIPDLISSLVAAGQRDAAHMLANEHWTRENNATPEWQRYGGDSVAARVRRRINHNGRGAIALQTTRIY